MEKDNTMSILTFILAFGAYKKIFEYSYLEMLGVLAVLIVVVMLLEVLWEKITN